MKRIRKEPAAPTPAPEEKPQPLADPGLARATEALERIAETIGATAPEAAPTAKPAPTRFSVTVTGRDEDGRIESFDIEVKNG